MAASFSNSSSSISRLQGAYNSSTGLVNSLAYPNNVSANSLLLASVTWDPHSSSSTPPPPTVSDSLGNSFNLVQTAYDSPETQAWCLYYAINTKGAGADTITVSYASGTGWTGLIIDEFSGVSTSSPLDGSAVQDQQNITGGTNTLSSGSFSTSSAGDLIYASTFNVNPNISSLVPGTNFTPGVTVSSFWGTAGPFAGTEYMTQSSPGSIAGNFTTSNTAGIYAITIGAAFRAAGAVPVTYTITPTAGSNGSISPSGAVKVNSGASQTFTFTPATGYQVSSVTVDGTAVTTASSYSFSNVTANHTIGVSFSPSTFTLTPSAGSNGTISPSGAVTVNSGGSQTFTFTPATGYQVSSVLVDGTAVTTASSYSFSNVTANHTIGVSFSPSTFTLTPSAGSNGTISPSGTVTVNSGGSQTFSFTPATGYQVGSVLIESSVGVLSSYTFSSVTANHTISATFISATI